MDKLIFLSNDDGYSAEGINQLAEMVREFGDVFVVAPDSGRSGSGMCTGTPDDCAKMAFEKLLPRVPDLVIGGINHGDNCAVNAHYSGTMAIALEGCLKGVPSIAFSSGKMEQDADFSYMTEMVQKIVKMVLENGLPTGVCLNVNMPNVEQFEGLKICKMGMGDWHEEWQERDHPRGGKYYWIAGYYAPHEEEKGSDTWAFNHGYVAVTPIQLDLTAYSFMEQLKKRLE